MNGVDKAFVFLVLITAYIVLGLGETVLFMKRRFVEQRQERLAQAQAAAAADAPRDEEVLRELGAFDDDRRSVFRRRAAPKPVGLRGPRRVPLALGVRSSAQRWPGACSALAWRQLAMGSPERRTGYPGRRGLSPSRLGGLGLSDSTSSTSTKIPQIAPISGAEQQRDLDQGSVGGAQGGGERGVRPAEQLAGEK